MARRAIRFHPEAVAEAQAAFAWYEERSKLAASLFLAELDRAVERIAANPSRWPVYLQGTRRFPLRRFPYLLIYVRPEEKSRLWRSLMGVANQDIGGIDSHA